MKPMAAPDAALADASLMAAVARGDSAAFRRLYALHQARIHRLAFGILLDPAEANEVVQEVFLRLHRAAPTWQARASLTTWLHRVTVNAALSLRRKLKRFRRTFLLMGSGAADPELAARRGRTVERMRASIEQLSARQRAIVTLYLDAELRLVEIAELLGMNPSATRVALHRALHKLRDELGAGEMDLESFAQPDGMTERVERLAEGEV